MLKLITENPLAAVFVACEVGLWVLLGAGLVLRRRAGAAPPRPSRAPNASRI